MLAADIVLDVSRFARRLCSRNGATFAASATTNGWLLNRDLLAPLIDAGVRSFQVSLDGDPAAHDRTRLMRSGRGTFETIYTNLLAIRDAPDDVAVIVRVHLSAVSLPGYEQFVDRLLIDFSGDPRFTIFMKPIEALGQQEISMVLADGRGDDVISRIVARHPGRFPLNDRGAQADHVCYAAKANSLVVRANGAISKCTVALGDDRNIVGRLTPDGELELDGARMKPWLRGLFSGNPDELSCPLLGLAGLAAKPAPRGAVLAS